MKKIDYNYYEIKTRRLKDLKAHFESVNMKHHEKSLSTLKDKFEKKRKYHAGKIRYWFLEVKKIEDILKFRTSQLSRKKEGK